jgi:tetraacyldisaccharide 4'-kinase
MQLKAPQFWESRGLIPILLWPLSLIYGLIIGIRKWCFQIGLLHHQKLPVPVIFVGNLLVGGTGKTPCVIALAKALYLKGFSPGVLTRGYRSSLKPDQTQEVLPHSTSAQVGDEALVLANHLRPLKIPVWVGAMRSKAGLELLQHYKACDVLLSDDGLQHYALQRHPARDGGHDLEIIVRDIRGEGNQMLLPAGPLREPPFRQRDFTLQMQMMNSADEPNQTLIPENTFIVSCFLKQAYRLIDPTQVQDLQSFVGKKIVAVAGIAVPEKFFQALRDLGLNIGTLALEDHANYSTIQFNSDLFQGVDVILMTEKDAVKCSHLQDDKIWVVPLEAKLPPSLIDLMSQVLHC